VPFLYTNQEGSGNPDGDWESRVGDSLTELYATSPPVAPHLTLGGSLRLVWPTGGQQPSRRAIPVGAFPLPRLSRAGSRLWPHLPSAGPLFHELPCQLCGCRENPQARTVSAVTFDLPDQWFIALYPENPIEYNEITGQWFVPFEAMVGKDIAERLRLGFGGAVKLGATIRSISTCSSAGRVAVLNAFNRVTVKVDVHSIQSLDRPPSSPAVSRLIALMTLLAVLAGGVVVSSRWAHSASEPMEPLPVALSPLIPSVTFKPRGSYVGAQTWPSAMRPNIGIGRISHHAQAMLPATDRTVLGDFQDASFAYAGVTSTFFPRDGKFMVRTDGRTGRCRILKSPTPSASTPCSST